MREINEIIVHCSATRPNWFDGKSTAEKVGEIRNWHVNDRGWSDIGYHYLIDRDGTRARGRPVERSGAHTRGKNAKSIGICLLGGHGSSENDSFSDNFTAVQDKAARALIAELKSRHGVTKVSGHNEYAAKACPGFKVSEWLAAAPLLAEEAAPRPALEPDEAENVLRSIRDRIAKLLDG
jgi:hypothetical protein